ncbi:MAG TPA: hypothetical protein VID20_03405 [Sphingomicrobium sp.]
MTPLVQRPCPASVPRWRAAAAPSSSGRPVQRVRISACGVRCCADAAPDQRARSADDFDRSADGRRRHSLFHGADGMVLSTRRAGGFVGAAFGLYAHDGTEGRAAQ